jgi:hypothetical protein
MKKIIVLFATILLFAVSSFAQIAGRVVDAKGHGVPRVTVTATGEIGAVAAAVTTDEDGNYAFEDLEPGKYKITAKGPAGFQPFVRESVNVAEDDTTTLDITLAAAAPPPAPTPTVKPTASPVKPPTSASPVDEIVDKFINANGGREKLLALKTVRMEGTLVTQGTDVAITVTKSHLIGMRIDISVMGTENYQIVTPAKGITFMPVQGMAEPTEMTDDQFKSLQTQLDLQGPFLDYRTKGTSVELQGTEKVNDEDCFKLKLTFRNGIVTTYFISSKTYLITKTYGKRIINGEETDLETMYSNYKKNADGYLFPYTTSGMQGETNYTKIETNIVVDPAIFKSN